MDEIERYMFDVNGYLVIEDALSPDLVQALNDAIDDNQGRLVDEDRSLAYGAARFAGQRHRLEFDDALNWPEPWGEPFRRLLSLPLAMRYMLEFLGEGFRCDTIKGTVMTAATEGFALHGGAGNPDSLCYYRFIGDQIRNGLMNVSYALTDVNPGNGGFACIPGSHKANILCPAPLVRMEEGAQYVRQIPVKAGAAVVFTEALMHGTLPWTAAHERRTVFVRYSPGAMCFREEPRPAGFETFADELTPLQRALLDPPYFRGRPRIAELLEKEMGQW